MEECVTFGIEAGFIQGKEKEDAQKMLEAIKRGVKPLPCKGKEACDAYCNNPDNMETCMNFAMEAGFMSEEEKAGAKGMLEALKKGVKPPSCKGKDECDAYCQSDEHIEECINFSVAAGMMDPKDAEMAKKTKGKGPGGCKGKEECEAFCKDPANQETCFNFAKDNGMIPEEDLKKMQEGTAKFNESLQNAPLEVLNCLNETIGAEALEKMKNGGMPPQGAEEKMRSCWDKGAPGSEPGKFQTGPGGCNSPEECDAYCKEHQEECARNNVGSGYAQPGPKQTGPGGCSTPEECEAYCLAHREECGAPSQGAGQNQPGIQIPPDGQIQPGQPCQGEVCQGGPLPQQPGQEILPGQNIQPPQTGPGAGGSLQPGEQVAPLLPPAEQQPQQSSPLPPPPSSLSPEPSPLSRYINTDSLVGSLIDAAFTAAFHK